MKSKYTFLPAANLILFLAATLPAQIQSWEAGPFETDFGNFNNWTTFVPHEGSIAAIGPHQNAENGNVILDQGRTIGAMLITDGMTLFNDGNRLTVNNLNAGGLTVAGQNSFDGFLFRSGLHIERDFQSPDPDLLVNGNLRILDGAQLSSDNGQIQVNQANFQVDEESVFTGSGSLNVVSGNNDIAIINDGTLRPGASSVLMLSTNGIVDLDGTNESGVLDAGQTGSQLLIVNGSFLELFDGEMNIGPDAKITFFDPNESVDLGNVGVNLSGSSNLPATLEFSGDLHGSSIDSKLIGNGHGRVRGSLGSFFTGVSDVVVSDNASLTFENLTASISGRWTVGNNGVLDWQDTLDTPFSNEVILAGGTIRGDGSTVFRNMDPAGIRGFGTFELRFQNDSRVEASGGTLVFDNSNLNNDWDGQNNNGQLLAIDGDLHLIDNGLDTFAGHIEIDAGREIFVDGFSMTFEGSTNLTGGTLKSNSTSFFEGDIAVGANSSIESSSRFTQANVVLNADLTLAGEQSAILTGTSMTGTGQLVNGANSQLLFSQDAAIEVDLVNYGEIGRHELPLVFNLTIDGDLSSYHTIEFVVAGTEVDEYSSIQLTGDLFAEDAIFAIRLSNYSPVPGDEFDLMDFANFQSQGYGFELPELWPGLAWDTSSFESDGLLRIGGVLLGDVNQDGTVDLLDVNPFVDLLSNGVNQAEADINQDGEVDLLDIALFVDLLSN